MQTEQIQHKIKWLVLKIEQNQNGTEKIGIVGIFSTQEKAATACKDVNYLIGPLIEDQAIEEDTKVWQGSYYPIA
ncbi:MAG: hypothetical protein QXF12_07840 [Candidatus Aenigmatarchaeota archaeon]